MIEKELKKLLDKEQYNLIKSNFALDKEIAQTNHYYTDDNGILSKNHITVRIREIEDIKLLQIKLPISFQNSLSISREIEHKMSEIPNDIDTHLFENLCSIKLERLKLLGTLTTFRAIYKQDDTELCLDKNIYLGKLDFELEIEYKDEPSPAIISKCNNLGISFNTQSQGKFARFLKELHR